MRTRRNDLLLTIQIVALVAVGLLLLLAVPAGAQESTPEAPVYVVEPGDTLYGIAERFGTTVEAIVAANDILDARLINVGQELIIPTEVPELVPVPEAKPYRRVHFVRPGETLPSLAFHYKTTEWALRQVNELDHLGLLQPGQDLIIPPPVIVITGTPLYPTVMADPAPAVQGQTMLVEVEAGQPLELQGSFLGQDLRPIPQEGGYWALVGVDALTPEGFYALNLTITETQSGDLLTMQETFSITAGDYGTYNVVVPADRQDLLDPGLSARERELINSVFAAVSEEKAWQGAFEYPLVGDVVTTAPFGQRRSYNGGPVTSYHSGQDLDGETGTPVYAPAAGTVVLAEALQVRGQVVILDHGLGVMSGYWHLSQIDVSEGQVVERGDLIGLMGNTGLSTGAHLHWEMRVGGIPVDPMQWARRAFP